MPTTIHRQRSPCFQARNIAIGSKGIQNGPLNPQSNSAQKSNRRPAALLGDHAVSKINALRVKGDLVNTPVSEIREKYGITPTIPSGTWAWTTAVAEDAREGHQMAMAAE